MSFVLAVWFCQVGYGQDIPDPSKPARLVNDLADVLSDEQEYALEQKLIGYEDSTSNQVCIVLVKGLNGYDVADYAVKLGLKWKVGTQKDNGVLILCAMEEHKSRIEVGYGLEARLTDALSKRIVSQTMKPYFKAGQYYEGLDAATNDVISVVSGEYKGDYQYTKNKKRGKSGRYSIWIILAVILIILFLGRKGGGGNGGFLTGMILGNLLGGGRRGGGFGDFSSGSGDFGGFGGFGGGSFGGGGASGDW